MKLSDRVQDIEDTQESIEHRLKCLERMVNKLTKHTHRIDSQHTDEVII